LRPPVAAHYYHLLHWPLTREACSDGAVHIKPEALLPVRATSAKTRRLPVGRVGLATRKRQKASKRLQVADVQKELCVGGDVARPSTAATAPLQLLDLRVEARVGVDGLGVAQLAHAEPDAEIGVGATKVAVNEEELRGGSDRSQVAAVQQANTTGVVEAQKVGIDNVGGALQLPVPAGRPVGGGAQQRRGHNTSVHGGCRGILPPAPLADRGRG